MSINSTDYFIKTPMAFFMAHNKNFVLEFHSRVRTAINPYNIFSNEIMKYQFSQKTISLSNIVGR